MTHGKSHKLNQKRISCGTVVKCRYIYILLLEVAIRMPTLNKTRMLQTLTRSCVVDVGMLTSAAVGAVQFAGTGVRPAVKATDRSGV